MGGILFPSCVFIKFLWSLILFGPPFPILDPRCSFWVCVAIPAAGSGALDPHFSQTQCCCVAFFSLASFAHAGKIHPYTAIPFQLRRRPSSSRIPQVHAFLRPFVPTVPGSCGLPTVAHMDLQFFVSFGAGDPQNRTQIMQHPCPDDRLQCRSLPCFALVGLQNGLCDTLEVLISLCDTGRVC